MSEETLSFQAEVSKLLDIVAHSLYSHREIFLRELVSNASDACDKLRHEALVKPELTADDAAFRITLEADEENARLVIADNGIGMNRQELIDNLGTIARSGTEAFVKALGQEKKGDVSLIGQFGVGFYSSFMVASKVEVLTLRAGEDQAWLWTSDGKGAFTIAEAVRDTRGTTITLHLLDDAKEFATESRLGHIVKTYSDHIAVPIMLAKAEGEPEQLNTASALWTRDKSEIEADQYKEFYHHVSHNFDDPWLTLHNKAEGVINYTNLLFVPTNPPFDLFNADRKTRVKLYVQRVFITDDDAELLPAYLRFVQGVVDAEDLPLNISRELLQKNPVLAKIRRGLAKRVLGELGRKAKNAGEEYENFWKAFGPVLKEGLYEDHDNRDAILPLVRFQATGVDGLTDLDSYVDSMKDGQENIYYITGDDPDQLLASPQLEGYLAKGVQVLLLTDPVDEFWVPMVGSYKDKRFVPVTQGAADLDAITGEDGQSPDEAKAEEPGLEASDLDTLIGALKGALGDAVKDVRASSRLTGSPVCLVGDESDMSIHLQRMLKAQGRLSDTQPRILEINPKHALILKLADLAKADGDKNLLDETARLLLDQARIVEGEPVPDPAAFAKRLSTALERGFV